MSGSWTGNFNRGFYWTTVANQPNVADWPNGTFNVQADIAAIGADILVIIGRVFRISADGATALQTGADFITTSWSTTGLQTGADTRNFDAGLASNRFGLALIGNNANEHKSETLTFNVNTVDEYADGPWSAPDVYFPPWPQAVNIARH